MCNARTWALLGEDGACSACASCLTCVIQSCTSVELTTSSATKKYRSRGTPGLGRLKIGGVAMVFLKAKKDFLQVSSYKEACSQVVK